MAGDKEEKEEKKEEKKEEEKEEEEEEEKEEEKDPTKPQGDEDPNLVPKPWPVVKELTPEGKLNKSYTYGGNEKWVVNDSPSDAALLQVQKLSKLQSQKALDEQLKWYPDLAPGALRDADQVPTAPPTTVYSNRTSQMKQPLF